MIVKILFLIVLQGCFLFSFELKSIEADFVQSVIGDDKNEKITYKGKLFATADSKAYWRYDSPIKKEIFVKQNQVIIYEPALEQAIVTQRMNLDFVAILNAVKENKNGLISEVNGQIFEIILDKDKPKKVIYKDELDNNIEIVLSNVILNQPIDYQVFNFKIPDNTDIIFDK